MTRSSTGERIESSRLLSQEELDCRHASSAGVCVRCGRCFSMDGHAREVLPGAWRDPGAAAVAYGARGAAAAAATAATTEAAPAAATADMAQPSAGTEAEQSRAKVPKLRKGGGVKQSGLRQRDVNEGHLAHALLQAGGGEEAARV